MRWGLVGILGLVGTGGIFLYLLSSPWLVWHTKEQGTQTTLVFSRALPASLLPDKTQYFTSVPGRWAHVVRHSSWRAWGATIKTLLVGQVPLHPAGILQTEAWFDAPTLVVVTRQGTTLRILAREASAPDRPVTPPSLPAQGPEEASLSAALVLDLSGATLAALPQPLTETWNDLLRARLGFSATKPGIVDELGKYEHIMVTLDARGTAVGIVSSNQEELKRWQATRQKWAVDEDRFRRPVEQAFRLPDGTLGRERVAGLPGAVWGSEQTGACRTPLPEKPALWACETDGTSTLATYAWQAGPTPGRGNKEWRVMIGPEFLVSLPDVQLVHIYGTATRAAGVIELTD